MLFADFWAMYPRRVAKRVAEKAWSKLTPEEQRAAVIALPDHIRYWRQTDRSDELIPHASTWLNQGRWEDELPVVQLRPTKFGGVVSELCGGSNVVEFGIRRVG